MKKKVIMIGILLLLLNLRFSNPVPIEYYSMDDIPNIESLIDVDSKINTYIFIYSEFDLDSYAKLNSFLRIFYYSTIDMGIELKKYNLEGNVECTDIPIDKCLNNTLSEPMIVNMNQGNVIIYDENDIDTFISRYY